MRFAARFTSTCPISFAPPSGILRLDLPKDGQTVAEPLRVSGISATGEIATDGGSVCTPTSLRLTSNALTCSSIDLNPLVSSQTITCSSDRSNPAVLKLHAIDSGLDGSTDVASDGGTDATSDGGTMALDGCPTPKPPSNVPVTCSIVFEKIQ